MTGFDIETTKLVAKDLGVEACFVQPTLDRGDGGRLGRPLDIAYGSGAINATRMEQPVMTQPYYYIPQRFLVRPDSPLPDGRRTSTASRSATCTSCTVESYLKGDARRSPASTSSRRSRTPSSPGSRPRAPGIDALADGKIDAFLAAEPVGLEAIKEGKPLRAPRRAGVLDVPERLRRQELGPRRRPAFVDRVNEIIRGRPRGRHAQGACPNSGSGPTTRPRRRRSTCRPLGQDGPLEVIPCTDRIARRRPRWSRSSRSSSLRAPAAAGSAAPAGGRGVDPAKDKLAQVLARGTLVLWTDPDYAPQSFAVKGATRAAGDEVRAEPADGARDLRLRRGDRQARRGRAGRRAVLRHAAVRLE